MSRKLRRKALWLVLLELVSLVVMGVFLTTMQSRLSLESYREDIRDEMEQVSTLLEEAKTEEQETIETDDEIYQSKAESIAFMANNDVDFQATNAKMREYADLLQVDNVLVVDRDGKQIARAQETAADFTYQRYNQLKTVFTTNEPAEPMEINTEDLWARYYSARIDDETMIVIEQNPEQLQATLDATVSQKSVLSNVSVGMQGFVFAVSGRSYVIEYHPDEDMIGKDALNSGVSVASLEDGKFSWITLDGKEYYCGVQEIDQTYYISAIPEKEIVGSRNITVGIILFIFFSVMTIVVTYGIFIMREDEKKEESEMQTTGKGRFHYNPLVGKKALVLSFVGIICILVIAFYMQTLFSLSNQSISNNQHVEDVEKTIQRYENRAEELAEQYNEWYLNKCQIAAYIVEHNDKLVNKDKLAELADILQIYNIFVFDKNGTVEATNSSFNNFTLSQDPEDQSYEFNKLLMGVDYLIQEAQPDEVSEEFYQYIGVAVRDEEGNNNGFVQIAIRPQRLENILKNMQISNVLDGVQVGGGGFAFAVDKEEGTFTYYPDDTLVGRKATSYGLKKSELKDGYCDYLTIESEKYYASSVETDDSYVYVAVPDHEIMKQRLPLTLATGVISFICIILLFILLSFKRNGVLLPDRKGTGAEEEDDRMINVVLPDGRVKQTESAASRWMSIALKWDEKTPEQQIATVVKFLIGILAVAICLGVVFREAIFQKDSIFNYIVDGGWEKGVNIFAITASIMIIAVVMTGTEIVKRILKLLASVFGARGETVCRLISSFIKYVAIVAMLYYCFALFGVDTATLLASAGILSIAISLGAKDMVGDILAGLFIIFEGEFRVGDIVMIGDWRGTVLEIGVRTTKIEDGSKNIKIIRNSNVTDVINMTKRSSYAFCDVGIEYGESLERVENILEKEFPTIRRHLPAITDGPFYKGVVSLGDNSVNVRILVQCEEADRIQLERDLNREMKLIFDKYDINIPFPQVVINQPVEFQKATEYEKFKARKFNEAQKQAAKDLGNEEEEDR